MTRDANQERYWLVDMDGYICLFSNMRLNRDTIPKDLFCYDVRDADCDGTFAEVQPFVMVNQWGTIISKEPVQLNEYGCYWPERDAFYFPADNVSLDEYQAQSIGQLVAPYLAQKSDHIGSSLTSDQLQRINTRQELLRFLESRTKPEVAKAPSFHAQLDAASARSNNTPKNDKEDLKPER